MSDAWIEPVVVDAHELRRLAEDRARLRALDARMRTLRLRQRCAAAVVVAAAVMGGAVVRQQATQVAAFAEEARQHRKLSRRAHAALTVLARSQDQILSATERAPAVGKTSWGGRFTVTKYLARSADYGKFNDGLTATLMKADPEARIIAVDPKVIPYGSWVWIEGLGWYQAQDCGSAIKGFRLDVLTATADDAMRFGRQERFVIVVPQEERSVG